MSIYRSQVSAGSNSLYFDFHHDSSNALLPVTILMLVSKQMANSSTEAQIDKLRHEYGLDKLWQRNIFDWLGVSSMGSGSIHY